MLVYLCMKFVYLCIIVLDNTYVCKQWNISRHVYSFFSKKICFLKKLTMPLHLQGILPVVFDLNYFTQISPFTCKLQFPYQIRYIIITPSSK